MFFKSKFLKVYLSITLAFFPALAGAGLAYGSELTPEQQLAQFQSTYIEYQTRLTTYTEHVNTYDPSNATTTLQPANQAVADFQSAITSYSQAVSQYSTALQARTSADAALTNQNNLIATSQATLEAAQLAASTSSDALANYISTSSYSDLLATRNQTYADYQATVVNSNVLEDFNNGQITSGIRFTLNGFDNPILLNSGNPQLQNGRIFVNQYGQDLYIRPPVSSSATSLGFQTYARNGDQTITVTFTDSTTATFTNPNGVNNPACPEYYCNVSYTAPTNKVIQSYVIPGDWDILYLDKFTFSSNSYDPTAYQTYLDAEQALAPVKSEYDSLNAANNQATSNLTSAQAAYDQASNATTISNLEATVASTSATLDTETAEESDARTATFTTQQTALTALNTLEENLPPTSLEVTSSADNLDPGTLRWAITQANATAGGYFDKITFDADITEPIVLTSDLPAITKTVEIVGNGKSSTVISGNDQFRPFTINSGAVATVSNMTLKDGKQTSGGLVYQNNSTFNSTNMRFTGQNSGSAVFIANVGVANYNYAEFDNNSVGVAGDWGSTPQLPAGVATWIGTDDLQFQNRTYINNSSFHDNQYGINNYRFTKVENSTFTNNGYGANITGLNRTQILNSTFVGNSIAYYNNVWMPTNFNMGTDNRLIEGNTFRYNGTAIYNDDGFNNGQKTPQWTTVKNNKFVGNSTLLAYYKWNSSTNEYFQLSTATATTSDFVFADNIELVITPPTNVVATPNSDGSVTLTWEPAVAENTTVERYAVSWTTGNNAGWGIASTTTSITITSEMFEQTGGLDATYSFTVRADNDTEQVYSQPSAPATAEVIDPTPATPTPNPTPIVTPSPSPSENPSPTPTPTPEPTSPVSPEPEPTPTPTVPPVVEPEPTPTLIPTPVVPEPVEPEPQPSTPVDPEPETSPEPEQQPTTEPEPEETVQPVPPTTEPEEPSLEPSPENPITSVEDLPEEISPELLMAVDLTEIVATDLSEAQVEALVAAALETFETAEPGSPEYEQALDALYVAAQADDIVLDEALAAIPLLGDALGGAVELFNALGNAGADMSPQVREQSEKVVIAAVIVGQIALMATSSATMVVSMNARN